MLARGILIFGGRTIVTKSAEDCYASIVIRNDSQEEARVIMEGDPGVGVSEKF